jgi:hypothetical protein
MAAPRPVLCTDAGRVGARGAALRAAADSGRNTVLDRDLVDRERLAQPSASSKGGLGQEIIEDGLTSARSHRRSVDLVGSVPRADAPARAAAWAGRRRWDVPGTGDCRDSLAELQLSDHPDDERGSGAHQCCHETPSDLQELALGGGELFAKGAILVRQAVCGCRQHSELGRNGFHRGSQMVEMLDGRFEHRDLYLQRSERGGEFV